MTIVESIAATTTASGLKVASALDTRTYQKGRRSATTRGNARHYR
jgi:hypothetical protein